MSESITSVEQAFLALAEPGSPLWGEAFAYLSSHPETSAAMQETFRETLAQMGVEPSGTDPASGEPTFTLADVARAMGIPEQVLEAAVGDAESAGDGH